MKNSPSILNPSVMQELIGNEPDLIAQFKKDFIIQAQSSLKELATHYNARDFEAIRQAAHFLKTSAKAIGAEQVTETLQQIEHAANAKDVNLTKQLIMQLKGSLQTLVKVINS
ncbi:Hpt domain-containing protein [Shewanella mesophila]|uniref:Hpt domain-containing protein n=1 Tax=Shewanella mesophila TaxID=2864208 RepID=UPI001C65FDA3|nr:Hpt domain-containing protein [Shewanella mesophila]QYJ85425.1 Hpt domain-containing protein [Shewanella mesophila]